MTYLEHFLDSIWFVRRILSNVGSKDVVGIFRRISSFWIGFIVPKLFEYSLGDVSVEIVDKDVL